jgi:hypothetical protein
MFERQRKKVGIPTKDIDRRQTLGVASQVLWQRLSLTLRQFGFPNDISAETASIALCAEPAKDDASGFRENCDVVVKPAGHHETPHAPTFSLQFAGDDRLQLELYDLVSRALRDSSSPSTTMRKSCSLQAELMELARKWDDSDEDK